MALQRRPRISCQLRCEIVQERLRTPATIVTLSEGGVGIKTSVAFEEGDEARICLLPERGPRIEVCALIWNERKLRDEHQRTSLRTFGCVVSHPPKAFLRLIDQMSDGEHQPPRKRATPREPEPLEILEEAPADPDLPCPRTPLAPHKPEAEDGHPTLRLRVKQVRGPRSRWLEIGARSLMEAQIWIRQNLEGEWEILEMGAIKKAGDSRRTP